jgi:hypothetical protein
VSLWVIKGSSIAYKKNVPFPHQCQRRSKLGYQQSGFIVNSPRAEHVVCGSKSLFEERAIYAGVDTMRNRTTLFFVN